MKEVRGRVELRRQPWGRESGGRPGAYIRSLLRLAVRTFLPGHTSLRIGVSDHCNVNAKAKGCLRILSFYLKLVEIVLLLIRHAIASVADVEAFLASARPVKREAHIRSTSTTVNTPVTTPHINLLRTYVPHIPVRTPGLQAQCS